MKNWNNDDVEEKKEIAWTSKAKGFVLCCAALTPKEKYSAGQAASVPRETVAS